MMVIPGPSAKTNFFTRPTPPPAVAPTAPSTAPSAQVLGNDAAVRALVRQFAAACSDPVPAHATDVSDPTDEPDDNVLVSDKPAQSWIVKNPKVEFNLNTKPGRANMTALLPSAVRVKVDQQFGKDDLKHCFTNDFTVRHTLLPILFREYFTPDDWQRLRCIVPTVDRLLSLVEQYGHVDFRPLRENFFPPGWEDATGVNEHRSAQLTACFLFYKGDAASVVRYIGGPLVGAHRDIPKILRNVRGRVPDHIYKHLKRLYTVGAPAYCNAKSSDRNLHAFLEYGNHSTAEDDIAILRKTLLKDEKRGHAIFVDLRLKEFVQNLHVCPLGLVDLSHKIKKPRPIYDASFRPSMLHWTCNNWTTKKTEPELEFMHTFKFYLIWLWNMRIRYPNCEIYLLDDDVTAAFRSFCWHPNLVSMHALQALEYLVFMARLTFGDNTSPPNSEPAFIARRELARYYFNLPNIVELAAKYMPNLIIVEPTDEEVASFMRIPKDSYNQGVQPDHEKGFAADTPQYGHHVDDNLYGALRYNIKRAIAASIMALYAVFGDPVPTQPDPFSYDKFELEVTHQRKATGVMIDSRTMYVWLPDYKRQQIVDRLADWVTKDSFTMIEGLELMGVLMDASRFNRWGRIRFFILQGVIKDFLTRRYKMLLRVRKELESKVEASLASYVISPAILKDMKRMGCNKVYAKYLYRSKDSMRIEPRLRSELQGLYDFLADFRNQWRINIGHMIPRDYLSINVGDASFFGVGFWSDAFRVICMIPTSTSIRSRCYLGKTNPGLLTMNILEYVTGIIDFACSITILEHDSCVELREQLFPDGVPPMPRVMSMKDNRVSETWIRKGATGSLQGQQCIRVMGELGQQSNVRQDGDRIDGLDNKAADRLSRPDEKRYSLDPQALSDWLDFTIREHPRFADYKVFMPSRNLFDAIAWALRPTDQVLDTEITPPRLVAPFGRFLSIDQFRVSMEFLHD